VCEIADTHIRLVAYYWFLHRIRKKVERDPRPYADPALVAPEVEEASIKPNRVKTAAAAA
jgi:hypothetical protein